VLIESNGEEFFSESSLVVGCLIGTIFMYWLC